MISSFAGFLVNDHHHGLVLFPALALSYHVSNGLITIVGVVDQEISHTCQLMLPLLL